RGDRRRPGTRCRGDHVAAAGGGVVSTVRLSHALALVTDRADSADFKIGLDGIESGTGRLRSTATTDFYGDGIGFREGDLLFGKLRPYLAKTWLADRDGAAVGDFLVLRPKPS